MKKINMLILLAIITIGCSQQEPVNFGLLENKAGVWKSFDNDGILEEEITYDNGKKISVKTY